MRKVPMSGSKDQLIDRLDLYQKNPNDPATQRRKGGRKKKDQGPEPVHNHKLDGKTHGDCEQCKIYGNPDDPRMQDEEFEITEVKEPVKAPEPQVTNEETDIADQLKNIVNDMNSDEDEEDFNSDGDDSDVEEVIPARAKTSRARVATTKYAEYACSDDDDDEDDFGSEEEESDADFSD